MASRMMVGKVMLLFKRTWNREVTDELMDIYHAAFEDLGDDELMVGAWGYVKDGRFFPTPIDILQKCGKCLGVEGAWSMVIRAEKSSDLPLAIRETIKNMGGLKMIREGDFRWMHRDFRQAYPEIADRIGMIERIQDDKLLPMIRKLVERLEDKSRIERLSLTNGEVK